MDGIRVLVEQLLDLDAKGAEIALLMAQYVLPRSIAVPVPKAQPSKRTATIFRKLEDALDNIDKEKESTGVRADLHDLWLTLSNPDRLDATPQQPCCLSSNSGPTDATVDAQRGTEDMRDRQRGESGCGPTPEEAEAWEEAHRTPPKSYTIWDTIYAPTHFEGSKYDIEA